MQIFKTQNILKSNEAPADPSATAAVDGSFDAADPTAADRQAIEGFFSDFAPDAGQGSQTAQNVVDPFLVDSASGAPGAAQAVPGVDPVTGLPLPHQGRKVPTITEILTEDPSVRQKMALVQQKYEYVIGVLNQEIAADQQRLRDPSLSAAELRQIQDDITEKQTELGVAQAGKAEAERYLAEDVDINKKELAQSTWNNPVDLNGDGMVGGKYKIGKINKTGEHILLKQDGTSWVPLGPSDFPKDPNYQAVLTSSAGGLAIVTDPAKIWESAGHEAADFDAVLGLKSPQSTIDLQIPEYVMVEKKDGELVMDGERLHPLAFVNDGGTIKQDISNSANAELVRVARVEATSPNVTKIGGRELHDTGYNQIITLYDKDNKMIAQFQIQGTTLDSKTAATATVAGVGNVLFASTVRTSVTAQNTDKVHSTQKMYDFSNFKSTGRYLLTASEMQELLEQSIPGLDMSKKNWEDAFIENRDSLSKEDLAKARLAVHRNIYDTFMGEDPQYSFAPDGTLSSLVGGDATLPDFHYDGASTKYIPDSNFHNAGGKTWTEGVVPTNGIIFNGLSGHIKGTLNANDIFVNINDQKWMEDIPEAYKTGDDWMWHKRTIVEAGGGRDLYFGGGNVAVRGVTFAWVDAKRDDETYLEMQDPKSEDGLNSANNKLFVRVNAQGRTFIDVPVDGNTSSDAGAKNGIVDDYFYTGAATFSVGSDMEPDIPAGATDGAGPWTTTPIKTTWETSIDAVTKNEIENSQTDGLAEGDWEPIEGGAHDTALTTLDGFFGSWAPPPSTDFEHGLDDPTLGATTGTGTGQ